MSSAIFLTIGAETFHSKRLVDYSEFCPLLHDERIFIYKSGISNVDIKLTEHRI